MKLLNWNIEWMNNWFVGGGDVAWKPPNGIADVQALAGRVADVIKSVDPDVLTLQEGPSDPREMDLFVHGHLSDPAGVPLFDAFGGLDGGAQKTYILVKRGGDLSNPALASDQLTKELFDEWLADVDGDMFVEPYDFTRDPLVLDGDLPTGEKIRVMTLHTKSKYVNQGEAMWNDPTRRQQFIVAALKNRRRISAEAMRTRRYLDELHTADAAGLVILAGDFNDGPGIDFFEKQYLTHGVADILMGSLYYPERQYAHGLVGRVPQADLFTARFNDFVDGIDDRPLLLDHVLLSPALAGRQADGNVEHDAFAASIDPASPPNSREHEPSDHRPISVEIQ